MQAWEAWGGEAEASRQLRARLPHRANYCPSSRHINTEFIKLYVAQSIAPNTQLINGEKCANPLFQKAGMCMGLCSGTRGPIKKKKKTSVLMEALLGKGFVGRGRGADLKDKSQSEKEK